MAWHTLAPDGTKSVKSNKTILQENVTYTEETLGNTVNDTTNTDSVKDHYWNVDANLDGRHRYINMPEYTIAGTAETPVIGASMDGVMYLKDKTDIQPFFANAASTMQMLGIRACATFTGRSSNGACDLPYSHNITSVTRTGTGQYTVVMTNALPSVNYIMLGGACRSTSLGSNPVFLTFITATTLSRFKTTTTMKIVTNTENSNGVMGVTDILQGWFFCFGG